MKRKESPPLPRTPGRPRSEKAQKDILESAYNLLKTKGISSVSAQEIANGAGVSTATLYRWWNTKEEIMFDACFEHVKPALSVKVKGSPLARLRDEVVRAAGWLRSEDAKVMARLITGIHGDKNLERTYLERFIFPRRQMRLRLVEEAIACGELKRDTDPDLFIDSLYGPLYYRWMQGHAPVDKSFAEALAVKIIEASCTPKWRARRTDG
jgi:AcrR family transcriptional regulator